MKSCKPEHTLFRSYEAQWKQFDIRRRQITNKILQLELQYYMKADERAYCNSLEQKVAKAAEVTTHMEHLRVVQLKAKHVTKQDVHVRDREYSMTENESEMDNGILVYPEIADDHVQNTSVSNEEYGSDDHRRESFHSPATDELLQILSKETSESDEDEQMDTVPGFVSYANDQNHIRKSVIRTPDTVQQERSGSEFIARRKSTTHKKRVLAGELNTKKIAKFTKVTATKKDVKPTSKKAAPSTINKGELHRSKTAVEKKKGGRTKEREATAAEFRSVPPAIDQNEISRSAAEGVGADDITYRTPVKSTRQSSSEVSSAAKRREFHALFNEMVQSRSNTEPGQFDNAIKSPFAARNSTPIRVPTPVRHVHPPHGNNEMPVSKSRPSPKALWSKDTVSDATDSDQLSSAGHSEGIVHQLHIHDTEYGSDDLREQLQKAVRVSAKPKTKATKKKVNSKAADDDIEQRPKKKKKINSKAADDDLEQRPKKKRKNSMKRRKIAEKEHSTSEYEHPTSEHAHSTSEYEPPTSEQWSDYEEQQSKSKSKTVNRFKSGLLGGPRNQTTVLTRPPKVTITPGKASYSTAMAKRSTFKPNQSKTDSSNFSFFDAFITAAKPAIPRLKPSPASKLRH